MLLLTAFTDDLFTKINYAFLPFSAFYLTLSSRLQVLHKETSYNVLAVIPPHELNPVKKRNSFTELLDALMFNVVDVDQAFCGRFEKRFIEKVNDASDVKAFYNYLLLNDKEKIEFNALEAVNYALYNKFRVYRLENKKGIKAFFIEWFGTLWAKEEGKWKFKKVEKALIETPYVRIAKRVKDTEIKYQIAKLIHSAFKRSLSFTR